VTTGRPHSSWGPVSSALFLFVLMGAVAASLGAALPALRQHFDVGAARGGSLVSLFNLGSFLVIAICGFGQRRLRPKATITVVLAAFAAGCVGIFLAPDWTLLQAAAVVTGGGWGGLVLSLNTAFAQGFGDRGVLMVNMLNAAWGAGAIGGPLLEGALVHVNARVLFLGAGIAAILCVPVRRFALVLSESPAGVGQAARLLPAKAIKLVLPFAAIGLLYDALENGVGAWESTHLTWIGFSTAAAAQIAGSYWAGLTIGRLIIPVVASKLAPSTLVFSGICVANLALWSTAWSPFTPYGYALAGLGLAPVLPTTLAWVARFTPTPQTVNAVILMAAMLGGVISPGLIGLVADRQSPASISISLAVVAALGLLAVWYTRRATAATALDPAQTLAPMSADDA
jgi:FHS family glucose/mannose:H+ symporter-like MFS transporter